MKDIFKQKWFWVIIIIIVLAISIYVYKNGIKVGGLTIGGKKMKTGGIASERTGTDCCHGCGRDKHCENCKCVNND